MVSKCKRLNSYSQNSNKENYTKNFLLKLKYRLNNKTKLLYNIVLIFLINSLRTELTAKYPLKKSKGN